MYVSSQIVPRQNTSLTPIRGMSGYIPSSAAPAQNTMLTPVRGLGDLFGGANPTFGTGAPATNNLALVAGVVIAGALLLNFLGPASASAPIKRRRRPKPTGGSVPLLVTALLVAGGVYAGQQLGKNLN